MYLSHCEDTVSFFFFPVFFSILSQGNCPSVIALSMSFSTCILSIQVPTSKLWTILTLFERFSVKLSNWLSFSWSTVFWFYCWSELLNGLWVTLLHLVCKKHLKCNVKICKNECVWKMTSVKMQVIACYIFFVLLERRALHSGLFLLHSTSYNEAWNFSKNTMKM